LWLPKQTTSIISLKRSASTESRHRDGRPNIPSDAIFGAAYSFGADQSGLKQINIAATVHLAPYKLEARDLSFCLSI
jgi:hypothetical protein